LKIVERVEADQAIAGQVRDMLDVARIHPVGIGKGAEEGRAAVVVAEHERDGQGAGVEGGAQAGVFRRGGVMREVAAQHHARGVGVMVERVGHALCESRKRVDPDDRLALGDEVDIGEHEDFLHGAACDENTARSMAEFKRMQKPGRRVPWASSSSVQARG
jgi:hypothetical protein